MGRPFSYASPSQSCPVCGKHSGCKLFHDGKVWCLRTMSDSESPPSYRFLGTLRGGMGGSLVPVNGIDKRGRKQFEKPNRSRERSNPLPLIERDRAIRVLHRKLGLDKAHYTYLAKVRGMSQAHIDAGLYFSLERFAKLPSGIPHSFPGACLGGDRLYNSYAGIACPTFSAEGLATGVQVRVLSEQEALFGRYRWLSGVEGEPSSHLPNGELPLIYLRPTSGVYKKNFIALVEGVGFKPRMASEKIGAIVIGASGGLFAASPMQLRHFIKYAAREDGCDSSHVVLYLDAGDINNHHVMHRVSRLVALMERWQRRISFAWWEQRGKDSPDIDELENLSAVQFISCYQFKPLAEWREQNE